MKKIWLALITTAFCLMGLLAPAAVYAQATPTPAPTTSSSGAKEAVCNGLGLTTGTSGCTPAPGQSSIEDTIRNGINILSIVIGVGAVIMIMIGGFKYITSGGDSNQVSSAKDTVLYAIVGLAIAALAQVIVRFVLTKFP